MVSQRQISPTQIPGAPFQDPLLLLMSVGSTLPPAFLAPAHAAYLNSKVYLTSCTLPNVPSLILCHSVLFCYFMVCIPIFNYFCLLVVLIACDLCLPLARKLPKGTRILSILFTTDLSVPSTWCLINT